MLECSWKQEYGIDCLTCGFQRSLGLLIKGEFVESFLMFPATIPFLLTILIAAFYVWKRSNNGHKWIISMFSLTTALILINYSVKIANGSLMH